MYTLIIQFNMYEVKKKWTRHELRIMDKMIKWFNNNDIILNYVIIIKPFYSVI